MCAFDTVNIPPSASSHKSQTSDHESYGKANAAFVFQSIDSPRLSSLLFSSLPTPHKPGPTLCHVLMNVGHLLNRTLKFPSRPFFARLLRLRSYRSLSQHQHESKQLQSSNSLDMVYSLSIYRLQSPGGQTRSFISAIRPQISQISKSWILNLAERNPKSPINTEYVQPS